jgi:hypothetical protein
VIIYTRIRILYNAATNFANPSVEEFYRKPAFWAKGITAFDRFFTEAT